MLVESSDAEEDAEIAKEPVFVYESWLEEQARKKGLDTGMEETPADEGLVESGNMETQEAELLLKQAAKRPAGK